MPKENKMPIIVAPGGWEETLPDWLFKEINAERITTALIDVIKPDNGQEQVGECEIMAYLMTVCSLKPLPGNWTKIYQYLTTQIMRRIRKVEVPDDIKVEELDDYEMRQLEELKSWLFKQRGGKARHSIVSAMKEVFTLKDLTPNG